MAMELSDSDRRSQVFTRATDLGGALARAIRQKQSFPEQQAEQSAFFERM